MILQAFFADKRGAAAMMFALCSIALLIAVAAGVDGWRLIRQREQMQIAADAAIIAAMRAEPDDLAKAKIIAENVFNANMRTAGASVTLTQPSTGVYQIRADASATTMLMRIAEVFSLNLGVKSEVKASSGGPIEVALVLDNTGSMVNDMGSLKTSAGNLVNQLFSMAGNNPDFRMSVVPFVAAVNPGRSVLEANAGEALDLAADSNWHGKSLRWHWIGKHYGCVPVWGNGPSPDPGAGGNGASIIPLLNPLVRFAWMLAGFGKARADTTANTVAPISGATTGPSGQFVPNGFNTVPASDADSAGCDWLSNPGVVSHLDLFNRLGATTASGAAWAGWKGCVEARPEPYDTTDDPPSVANSNTRFVPYFWPDESDQFDPSWVPAFNNSYLADGVIKADGTLHDDPTGNPQNLPVADTWTLKDDYWQRSFNLFKYNSINKPTIDETAPDTKGPNKACPDEVLRLTNAKQTILNKINSLNHWNGGGTIIGQGLVWGWRTLSPSKPFADAKPYAPDTQKVIVLMTDGKNELGENGRAPDDNTIDGSPFYSDYSAYGYLRYGHFPTATFSSATAYLDQRMQTACTNAKAKGITIFTVLFRETDPNIASQLSACATSSSYAFTAADATALNNAFQSIGASIAKLHLSK